MTQSVLLTRVKALTQVSEKMHIERILIEAYVGKHGDIRLSYDVLNGVKIIGRRL